jgi:hypothetical protein
MEGRFMPTQLDTLNTSANGTKSINQLDRYLRSMLQGDRLQSEVVYRMAKLLSRLDVIADKFFLKTVKAQEILAECLNLSQRLRPREGSQEEGFFILLTEIEQRIEHLVQKAHEFRVKAG